MALGLSLGQGGLHLASRDGAIEHMFPSIASWHAPCTLVDLNPDAVTIQM